MALLRVFGIMTTTLLPRGSILTFEFEDKVYTIAGISKGCSMIRPNYGDYAGLCMRAILQ